MYHLYPLCEYNGKKLFPKTNRKEECYVVGKLIIRIDRIINEYEILLQQGNNSRYQDKYEVQYAKASRLQNSPVIYMQKLLNENER